MGDAIVQGLKKRNRTIIGVAVDPPMGCPFCGTMKDVFERVEHEGRVILICSECMDNVIEQVRERWKEELSDNREAKWRNE